MSAAQNINVPNSDEREQDVYSPRSEEDLEQVIDRMEDVENEDLEDAVRQISEIADDNLRGAVTEHFQAPIRSLNNPEENTVELEDGTEAQVVGEEYFVNQNLSGFQDVGNIKWWTLMDEDSYREETRWVDDRDEELDQGLEHLTLENEGDIHGYHVELDGEPVEPEQAQRLAINLRIRQDNTVFEGNQVPRMMLENSSVREAVSSENIERDEFEEGYEEAREIGLVSENGNLTLKGWLSAVDLEAPDIRSLEDKDDVISFANLEREHIPGEVEEFTEVGNVNLTFTIPEGRYADEERVGDYEAGATVNRTDRYTEFETEDLVEDIIFGKGFGGLSISDVEEGEVRELNSKDVGKVAELMENDPFTEQEFIGTNYGKGLLELFEYNKAHAENFELQNAQITAMVPSNGYDNDETHFEELIQPDLDAFGYSSTEELLRDSGLDKELEETEEILNDSKIKVKEKDLENNPYVDDEKPYIETQLESNVGQENQSLKDHILSDLKEWYRFEDDDGVVSKRDLEVPLSTYLLSTHREEFSKHDVEIDPVSNKRRREYDIGSLQNYSQELRNDIEKMDDRNIVDLEENKEGKVIKTRGRYDSPLKLEAEFEYSVDRIMPDNLEVEASYQQDSNGVASNDALREIGAALDPMNFDSESYEDIEVETDFQYGEATDTRESQQAAAV